MVAHGRDDLRTPFPVCGHSWFLASLWFLALDTHVRPAPPRLHLFDCHRNSNVCSYDDVRMAMGYVVQFIDVSIVFLYLASYEDIRRNDCGFTKLDDLGPFTPEKEMEHGRMAHVHHDCFVERFLHRIGTLPIPDYIGG